MVVVGGAGFFGGRLVRGLLATTDLPVIVAGRDGERARRFVDLLGPAGSRATAARLDARRATPDGLRALGAFALVDAAGPFQDSDHRLAEAAIEAGLQYLDLADGRAFVVGIRRLDAAARRARVVALSGASSTPALSHAALDGFVRGWRFVDAVEVAICPGNRSTPNGASVVRAILSYVGRPVRIFLDGRWQERPGWGLTVRRAVPGLGARFLSLCETPDLDLLPERFAVRRDAVFRAVATGGDGPAVPTLPALATLRALAAGEGPEPGARPCVGHLDLAAMEAEFGPYRIATSVSVERGGAEPFIAAALGRPAFDNLPAAVRRVHEPRGMLRLLGRAAAEGAETALGRWIARLFGFPPAGDAVPVEIEIAAVPEGEDWTRGFGGRRFRSRMRRHGRPGYVRERFGPFGFDLALSADAEGLRMRVDGWRLGRVPLPRAFAPRGEAREWVDAGGRFRFDVPVRLPLLGRIVRYSGWLVPAPVDGA